MQDEFDQITAALTTQFLKNLDFLKKDFPKVFEKIEKLSSQINNNSYQEKFSLEFKDDGYFDILDIKNDKFVYGHNSFFEAEKRTENINFTQDQSINLLRINHNDNKLALMQSMEDALPLVDYLNNTIDFDSITFSKIFKFVFIGVGAGVHINDIHKKTDSMTTLIIEPNLEIFRLSLFLLDYSMFTEGSKSLYLSVDETLIERNNTFLQFEAIHSYMNYNVKHHLFSADYKYILDELIDHFSENSVFSFSYHETLKIYERTLGFAKRDFKFLQKELFEKEKILKDRKILLISAGPSIDKEIAWIKKHQDKFIIISIDLILKKLEKNGIKPDIVVSIDPKPGIIASFFDTKDKNFLKDSAIIFLSQQDEDVIEKVKHLDFYFSQVINVSEKIGYSFSIPNVGAFAFGVALKLGATELYLIGNDAAFNQETGSRYSEDNEARTVMDKLEHNMENRDDNLVTEHDILEVKGNFREKINTNRELYRFKKDYEGFIHSYLNNERKDFNAYNLSDGAFIEGLIPLETKNIHTEDIKPKNFEKNELEKVTTIIDDLDFDKDLELLTQMITRVKKFQKVKVSSKDDFLEQKLDLMIWILEKKKVMSNAIYGNIFLKFAEAIDTYVNFTLNLKQKETHSKEVLMNMKRYWSISLITLFKKMKYITSKQE